MNYKDLDDKEIEAILRCYDSSIKKFHKMKHIDVFEVFYKNEPPMILDIKYLNNFIIHKKIQYRDMRLNLMLK